VLTANDTVAALTAGQSRRSRKNSTNAAGVSFTAAARPTSAPRRQRGAAVRQSAATRAISATLTWP
jgi:hypothetical protein